jgi:hypothetical protein
MDNNYRVYFYLRSRDSAIGKAGTPYYVGKGKGRRAYEKSHSVPVPKDKNNIVFVLNNLTEEQAFRNERDFISWYGRVDSGTGILRNLTDGGEGVSGWIPSEETKRKISEAGKGELNHMFGKHHSVESRRKISESNKGELNYMFGKHHSVESRRKMSEANKGNTKMLGKTHSEETKRKMSEARKLYYQNRNKTSVTLDQFFKE